MAKVKSNYPEINDIKEDLDSLKKNTVELSKHIKKDGEKMGAELKETASNNLRILANNGKEQLRVVEKQVQAQPLKSLAVAFVAGALVSALMGRR